MPTGPAELVVVVAWRERRTRTLGDLARSEFFGMWRDSVGRDCVGRDRVDLADSAEYARQLRADAWRRAA